MMKAVRLAAAYAATALLAAFVAVRLTAHGAGVTVPPVAGLELRTAQRTLAGRGLESAVAGEEWSEQQPPGVVLSQQPAAATRVKRGRRVKLVISRGSEILTMPQLRDLRLDEAEFLLRQLGLESAAVATAPSALPRRTVLAQDPPPGARLARGAPVRVLASDGPAVSAIAMPRVAGMATRAALA
ncbi:MAG: PASTA domain-containing protein, partial [bacterium]